MKFKLIVILIALLFSCSISAQSKEPSSTSGDIELSAWDLDHDEKIEIDGSATEIELKVFKNKLSDYDSGYGLYWERKNGKLSVMKFDSEKVKCSTTNFESLTILIKDNEIISCRIKDQ